jgi:hypothetical protein
VGAPVDGLAELALGRQSLRRDPSSSDPSAFLFSPGRQGTATILPAIREGEEEAVQMNASVLLANFSKVSDNMLDVQGGGWSFTGPGPVSFFVCGIVTCSWHEANARHEMRAELLDADGGAVPHPENGNPVIAAAHFEVGRPAGLKAGTSLRMPFAIPFGAFQLEPGGQYEIRFSIDGESRDDWRLPFTVREAPPEALAA